MKKLVFTAFAVGLSLTANFWAQVPSYVPTNGLVGYWPFNGNANDESGNGNNGTVNGATLTADRNGVANKAYSFDGVNNKIVSPIINPLQANWSVSFWYSSLNSTSNFQGQNVIGLGSDMYGWGGAGFQISGQNPPGQCPAFNYLNQMYMFDASQECGGNYLSGGLYSNSTWFNVVIIKNNLNYDLIINNVMITSSVLLDIDIDQLIFGNRDISFQYFNGNVDDIGIWDRALTQQEISALYNGCSGNNISLQPVNVSVITGTNAQFTVNASSGTTYQWQSNPLNTGWLNLTNNPTYGGGTTNTLTISNVQLSNHNQPFRVIANNGNCSDTSNVANIQITDTCINNVTVYDTLLTTVTDTLIINTTLSLPAPNNENTILIYPNPASDHITIDNGNYAAMAGYTIKIENNAGQQVFQSLINQAQFYVDLSTWSGNGLYFVHLIDLQNNTVTVRKIVLQ